MMTSHEILSVYQTMRQLSGQMLAAAINNDWDQLTVLEQRCAAQVNRLREQEPAAPLEGAEREQKIDLIKQMLSDDRQIRDLTAPWMAQLSALINNNSTQRLLARAYQGA